MRYLLDTNALLWLLAGSDRVSDATRDVLADPLNDVFVSAVNAWEIAIKVALGKLDAPPDVRGWLPLEVAASKLGVLPITLDHAVGVEYLPLYHTDPFDRLLIAQAIAEGMTIVSDDRLFDQYGVRLMRC